MPTPITTTTVNFNYKIADELYSQTDTQGKTLPAIYTGPDRIWVFVDAATGTLIPGNRFYTTADDGPDIPTPAGELKVEIVAAENPLIISTIYARACTFPGLVGKTETLVNGVVTLLAQEDIHNTYNMAELTYNAVSKTWSMPYKASPVTWDDVLNIRNGRLTASDGRIAPDMPANLKTVWMEYRQKLRDLPTTFGKGTPSETPAWKIQFPDQPAE
jgi:hypothetical protein